MFQNMYHSVYLKYSSFRTIHYFKNMYFLKCWITQSYSIQKMIAGDYRPVSIQKFIEKHLWKYYE